MRWFSGILPGLYRSVVLIALTVLMPVIAVLVGFGGSQLAYSWTADLSAPVLVRALAVFGETLVIILWIGAALWITHLLTSRQLAQAARGVAHSWLGMRFEVAYRPVPPVTRMANGHWWDGEEYHKSEREARRRARIQARFHDAQLHWDGLWAGVAGVTVLPVAALPVLGLAGGLYLVLTSYAVIGVAAMMAGLAAAPFAWRILRPVAQRLLGSAPRSVLGKRVDELEAIRADQTQAQAAELERIERGLHDGAQARLVAMGMAIQAAQQMVDSNPDAAKKILADARSTSATALAELRSLVRGINPPVLTERGLVDAVRALALDAPLHVDVHCSVPSRPERPIESAVYFAVAELLANVAKHAHASEVRIELGYFDRMLTATVTDDGVGGAAKSTGSGLNGLERRMMAFGGRLEVDSPVGGPTRVSVEVPCVLS
ncbi:sensor histidine kinase [Actinoplanes sp. N902-109]|uniref:sensor histidine kinase n=1 Tax=Actinoplanes sp. (strain N902-109) TaxID=649831 RepID=UPI000329556C|nr:sensor histidine kinase [Actinoplanes sp. N902-109]AGL16020.1 histidine kinase [Actinoplanes sp. N902-109]